MATTPILPTTIGVNGHPSAVAVNPITNKIYVTDYTNDDISVIDGASSIATTLVDPSFVTSNSVAVNTVTNEVYVANEGTFSTQNGHTVSNPNTGTVTIINGATSSTAATVASVLTAGTESFAVAVNQVTNKIYVANKDGNNIAVIDANNGNALTTVTNTNPDALTCYAIAVNPTSNKIYVANYGAGTPGNPGNVTIIDGATNTVFTITDPTAVGSISVAVNPVTNQAYIANETSNTVTQITEQQQQTIPITPGITALSNNLTNTATTTFTFAAANTLLTSGTVNNVFFQVDTWQGPWTATTNSTGNTFTGSTGVLKPGFHILYAYATDGEAGTSTITGLQSSPLIGNVAGYGFLVTAQSALTQTTPVITWPTPSAITYGTTLGATQLNATATVNGSSVPGTFVYTPASGALLTVGTQTLSVTFTPTDMIDYTTATGTATLVVNKVTSTINWTAPASVAYGTPLSSTQLNATVTFNGPTAAGTLVYSPVAGTVLAPGSAEPFGSIHTE